MSQTTTGIKSPPTITEMDSNEFAFLTDSKAELDPGIFYEVGESCYENGWTDMFGFITPQGYEAIDRFVNG